MTITQLHRMTASPSPHAVASDDASPARRSSLVNVAVPLAGVAVVIAGVAAISTRHPSKAIGAIEGVTVLSNPRLPSGFKDAQWAVPQIGSVFGAGPKVSLTHAVQGGLGDCWDIASIAAIAKSDPQRIEQLVRETEHHVIVNFPSGPVAVTKELPLTASQRPAFAANQAPDHVHWAAYLEKAQAAIARNGYESLEGHGPRGSAKAFQQLYGTKPVVHSDSGLTESVAAALAAHKPVTVASLPGMGVGALNVRGNHVYTVTGSSTNAAGEHTFELFNPWGHSHPTRPLTGPELESMFVNATTPY